MLIGAGKAADSTASNPRPTSQDESSKELLFHAAAVAPDWKYRHWFVNDTSVCGPANGAVTAQLDGRRGSTSAETNCNETPLPTATVGQGVAAPNRTSLRTVPAASSNRR